MKYNHTRQLLVLITLLLAFAYPARHGASAQAISGNVLAWGFNHDGQIGDGTTTNSLAPISAGGLSDATAISAGTFHSLALKASDTVWAWGDNTSGQLGNDTFTASPTPVEVVNLSSVVAIAAGGTHSLAIKSDGSVWAWGNNTAGQLGDGTIVNRSAPVRVADLDHVIGVAAGRAHSLALKSDGTVWAWGLNDLGQLGDGTNTNHATPVQVAGLAGIQRIASQWEHSLALKSDGSVWAWGMNDHGQVGDGSTTNRVVPVQVTGLENIVGIAAGFFHSMAIKADRTLWGWGDNSYAQLSDGTLANRRTPVRSIFVNDVIDVAGGIYHSMVRKADGSVWGWGSNYFGQLGDGSTTSSIEPVQPSGFAQAVAIASGYGHVLAIVRPSPTISIAPTSVEFGNQHVDSTSAARTITIGNTGDGTLTISSITLSGPQAGDYSIGFADLPISVPPGSSTVIDVRFTPSASGSRSASIIIADDAQESSHSVALSGTGIGVADLALSLSADQSPVKSRAKLAYVMTIQNAGQDPASLVVLDDALPAGTTFVSATPSQGTCSAPGTSAALRCDLGEINRGASATVNLVVQVTASGGTTLKNTARVSATSYDPNGANNTAVITTKVVGSKR